MRQTSLVVFEQIRAEGLLSKQRLKVYEVLYSHGPMTQSEAEESIRQTPNKAGEMNPNKRVTSYHKRFAELQRQNAIVAVNERPCRVTGRTCIAWDVTASLPIPIPRRETTAQKLAKAEKEIVFLKSQIPKEPAQLEFPASMKTIDQYVAQVVQEFVGRKRPLAAVIRDVLHEIHDAFRKGAE